MSSFKYTLDDQMINDVTVHLTNNAIQKKGKEYGKLEDGNQLSYDQATVSYYNNNCLGSYRY